MNQTKQQTIHFLLLHPAWRIIIHACFPHFILIVSLNGGQLGANRTAALSSGVLENTDTVTCAESLPTGLPKISTPAGDYSPASNVGFSLSLSIATRSVTTLIVDNPDYAAIRTAFKDLGLGGSADTVRTGEPVYEAFRAYFGSNTWITDYFYGTADGSLTSSEVGFMFYSTLTVIIQGFFNHEHG